MLADRFGDRLLITLSTGGAGVSALVLAAAPTFWLFAAGAVCLGGVAGFHYSVGTAYSRASTTTPEPRSGSTTWGLRSPGWPHLSSSRRSPSDTAGDPPALSDRKTLFGSVAQSLLLNTDRPVVSVKSD